MRLWRKAALGVGAALVTALSFADGASANHNLIQHASTGSTDPNSAENIQTTRISASGNTVIFNSGQALTTEDVDTSQDVFARRGGETFLVSAGEINGTGAFPAGVLGLSDDGSRIWFETREQLVPGDTDSNLDVYERYQGQTRQVSAGAINGNQGVNSVFQGSSPDGARVYFRTIEQLTADDVDGCGDIYERSGGVTTLVSGGKFECHGGSPIPISMVGYADTTDGPAVFVETSYRLIAEDADALTDVYEVVDGEFRLLSQGPGTSGTPDIARVVEISAQGHAVLIWSAQPLTSDDLDSRRDLFLSQNNSLARVSKGPIGGNGDQDVFGVGTEAGMSADGEHVFFSTTEQLTVDDTNPNDLDLYEYDVADDSTRLIGDGAFFRGASADGSTVVFLTSAALVPGDADGGFTDIYKDEGGVVTHVSAGNSPTSAIFSGISLDGRRIFFLTEDSNSPGDTNGARDLYEHFDGSLHLLSRDSTGLAGGAIAVGGVVVEEYRKGLAPDGLSVAFTTTGQLLPSDTDSNIDIYVAARSDPYPRPKAATPISVALVPAYATCTSPNRVHAAPLSFGSCSPPDHLSPTLTVGTGDGSPAFARSVGSVRINALPGIPGGVDDADVRIRLSITNVMRKSDLSDYTGELGVDLSFQMTDREGVVTQTSMPSGGSFAAPCTATVSTIDGATCAVDTTVEALIPNAITEGARAIFELGPIEVRDGGTDEDADTVGDDGLLARQGVFIP